MSMQVASGRSSRFGGRRGQTAIILTVAFGTMLALLGLVFDGGRIYFEKRHMQAAADAAVFGAVQEMRRGSRDVANVIDPAARYDAGLNGYDASNSTVTVNSPPVNGSKAGNNNFVEVIIEQTVPSTFMRVVNRTQSTVRVRAVGGMVWGGDPCLVALNTTAPAAFRVNGNTTVDADCGVYSNSDEPNALNSPSNSGCINGTWAGVSGGANGTCMNFSGGIDEGLPPIPDPLAVVQPEPSCSSNGRRIGSVYTPGRYTSGININNGSYTFQPGIYCLENGMHITGGTASGSELLFFVVNSAGNNSKSVQINGGAEVHFAASTDPTDPYRGILFWGSRSNPYWGNPGNHIEGSANSTFTGAIYFRNEHIDFAGNTSTTNEWAMVIGDTVDFIGNSGLRFIRRPTDPATAPPIFRVALTE